MRTKYTPEKRAGMAIMGNRLQEVRKEAGMSLGEIADRLNRDFGANINKGMLSKYENGIHEPSAGVIHCMSKILGVSGDYILGRTDERTQETPKQGIECTGFCVKVCTGVSASGEWSWDESRVHIVPVAWLVGGREFFGYVVKGNRMAPRYYDGDVIIFERKAKSKKEQTTLVKIGDDEAILARIIKKRDGKEIIPLDPALSPKFFTTGEFAEVPVKVLGFAAVLHRAEV